jgi:plastocyanin
MRSSLLILLLPSLAWGGSLRGKVARNLVAAYADAVVYIAEIPGKNFPAPSKPVTLEQRAQAFAPHVLAILRGTTVKFPNHDRIRHNVFSPAGPKPFNFGIYPPGAEKELLFDQLGVVMLLCNIHENMSGFILVLQNPFFASPGADGRYTIENVPDGAYTVSLWAEGKPPQTRKVTVHGDTELDFK